MSKEQMRNRSRDPSSLKLLISKWRSGPDGRTVYAQPEEQPSERDRLIGVMDTSQLTEAVCIRHNDALDKTTLAERQANPPIMMHPYEQGQTVAVSGIPGVPNGSKLWIKRVESDGTLVFEL